MSIRLLIFFGLLITAPFYLGTTYVIWDDGREVARYHHEDGSYKVVMVAPAGEPVAENMPPGAAKPSRGKKSRKIQPENKSAQVPPRPEETAGGLTSEALYVKDGAAFFIKNFDNFVWSNCRFEVQADEAYAAHLDKVLARPQKRRIITGAVVRGKRIKINAAEFVSASGKAFVPADDNPIKLSIACAEGTWNGMADRVD